MHLYIFSRTGQLFYQRDKLSLVFQHGFLRSKENVIPVILDTIKGVWENVFPQHFQYLCKNDVIIIHVSDLVILADVIAYILWYFLLYWQMD